MKEIKINVKEKSTKAFLENNAIEVNKSNSAEEHLAMTSRDLNVYYFMKDELYLKKSCGLDVDELIKFEISDTSSNSKKELINTYVYKAEHYDDVSLKLVLMDFSIKSV